MQEAPGEKQLGERLYEAGWRQGAIFSPEGEHLAFAYFCNDGGGKLQLARRDIGAADQLIVVSQDCDIVAAEGAEPCIEFYVCRPERSKFCNNIAFGSRRYFLVHPDTRLVAHATRRLFIEKTALSPLQPTPWPSSANRFRRFVRWLGDRYTRPPLPNELVDHLQRPVESVLDQIADSNPQAADALSRVAPELRFALPSENDPPFGITLLVLMETVELTEAQADAIDVFEEALREALDPNVVRLQELRWVTLDELSTREYLNTYPIYREHLTYRGEDLIGAEPT